ncbi:hypothetical protein [Aquimarina sp. AU474]|uniref:hypothetical protein n=1 Tax=Aquimarina sp. AU474 TaxID=2108529 RepID=UPI000D68736E|nr:hypothetical protein [Aquimarina sp. AU474]
MTIYEHIEKIRNDKLISQNFINSVKYEKSPNIDVIDNNIKTRTEIVELLLADFSNKDIDLIRFLFDEEFKCAQETRRQYNLYQLSFYLYNLGNLQDIYRIYAAKYKIMDMDIATMMDRSMLYMNHKIDSVIEFVENDFKTKDGVKAKYPEILDELYDLKQEPDYENEEAYNLFIRGYFYGHKNISP